jgi:hypothetical protein
MSDLVTRVPDRAADPGPALGAVAGDEERGPDRASIEDSEEAGDAGSGSVGLMAHHVEPGRRLGVIEQDRALRIDVEREAGGGPDAVRPAEAGRHGRPPVEDVGHRPKRRNATSDSIS